MRAVNTMGAALLVAVAHLPGAAQEQEVGAIPLTLNDAPVTVGSLNGTYKRSSFFEPAEGLQLNVGIWNSAEQELVATEVVVLLLDPWNLPVSHFTWTSAVSIPTQELGGRNFHNEEFLLDFTGAQNVFTVIAWTARARLADGTIWAIDPEELNEQLAAAVSGLDFSAYPSASLPATEALTFEQARFDPTTWEATESNGCVRYTAVATPAGVSIDGRLRRLSSGDVVRVCDGVVHLPAPRRSPPGGSVRVPGAW